MACIIVKSVQRIVANGCHVLPVLVSAARQGDYKESIQAFGGWNAVGESLGCLLY